ncbi:hypothetical protein OHB26_29335 [Nocardia sp. NBC_01503]|uniref:hypothetical protein n=1 Tax=Nocardia sp. NBC_01503 TaxID=2975997 RepID=UPI002E7BD651|nr:hypothetical protein [Nocardia sp. NBC_01503]WTL30994.1 hypothetical protein OHB26_29335 [Nocardia sp. NBC_01503]
MLKIVLLLIYSVAAQAVIYTLANDFTQAMLFSLVAGLVAAAFGWRWRGESC